jgi:hypothetical protein
MKSLASSIALLAGLFALPANAQFSSAAKTQVQKGMATASGLPTGGFLGGGSDDCASAQAIGGTGLFPFSLVGATTGPQGQNENICLAFGTTGITNDVWYVWTSPASGLTTVATCAQTSVDTKIAAYPGSSCPADGTAIACSDDACGLQSSISFPASNNGSYMLQIGTFPGASQGTGNINITQLPDPPSCPDFSDGAAENSIGLTVGGDLLMLQYFDCLQTVACVEVAFGTPAFPDPSINGIPVTVAVLSDTDANPQTGMVLLATTSGVISDGSTNTFVRYSIDPPAAVNGSGWVAVIIACHLPGQFPAALDQSFPYTGSWVGGDTTCNLDVNNLPAGNIGTFALSAIGFPGTWLIRASETSCTPPLGTAYCFGNGCPCGNDDPDAGCANSTGTGGLLTASGSDSAGADDLGFTATNLHHNKPALLFSAADALGGGNGIPFGNGLRCAGIHLVRHGTRVPDASGTASWNGGGLIAQHGGAPGEERRWQVWYREPFGPCSPGFNLTNAIAFTYSD